MTFKYGKFEMPQRIITDDKTSTSTFARFTIEPFERGFGHTIGNSMRRIMLTSLEAPAITAVRIEGVPHEYMSIEGVIEDMTNIILNFKGALLRKVSEDDEEEADDDRSTRIIISLLDITQDELDRNKGNRQVTLGDLVKDNIFEVVNPDLVLFTVTRPFKRQIDLTVGFGRGYVPSERHVIPNRLVDQIPIDTAFSPVRLVNYYVENTRVGQDTDFDRLILEVTTDGRVTPNEALSFASQIAVKHFDVFNQIKSPRLAFEEGDGMTESDQDDLMEKLALRVDEIELSVRSTNCLSGANIETIAELVSIPERKMLDFRNFGKKSLNEIKAKLTDMGLSLGMDLSKIGITPDNVKDFMRKFYEERKRKRSRAEETDDEDADDLEESKSGSSKKK